jgi:hypothetical protein
MKKSRLLGAVCALLSLNFWLSFSVHAGTISYTGADLYNDPNVSFPTTTPQLDGESLVFGTGSSNDKLLVLPLFTSGSLPQTHPTDVEISINLTRLACVGYCVDGSIDHDPEFLLRDGSYLVGAVASNDNGGQGSTIAWSVSGTRTSASSLFTNAGYPNIGDSVDIYVTFTLDNNYTEVGISYLAGSGTTTSTTKLNIRDDLDFVLLRDNDAGEQYQINSLTFTSSAIPAAVPIPSALWLFGSGLLGLIGVAKRRGAA